MPAPRLQPHLQSKTHHGFGIRPDRLATIRATAILGVVFYHALTTIYSGSAVNAAAAAAQIGGFAKTLWSGVFFALSGLNEFVVIFFILSGYLAHSAYQRSLQTYPQRSQRTFAKFFLWRRFWRLVPPFWAALLFSYFVTFDHPFTWNGARKLLVNASLFKTLYPGYFFSINYAHWYVAVQWQLDLLYPLFLYIVRRRSLGVALAVAWTAAVAMICVVPRFTSAAYIVYLPFRWWAEWSLGVYLQSRHAVGARVFRRPILSVLVAAGALVAGRLAGWDFVSWLAIRLLLASGFEALVLSRSPRLAVERRIAPIAACSYSLYLLHLPVQLLVARAAEAAGVDLTYPPAWLGFALASFAVAWGLAWLSAEWIEKKSSVLGNRIWRRRFLIRYWLRARRSRIHLRRMELPADR